MGFISSAYSAQLSPTVAVSSRFGVNVYSYESDLSLGAEWWIGRRRGKRNVDESEAMGDVKKENHPDSLDMRQRESSVRFESLRTQVGKTAENEKLEDQLDSPIPLVSKMEEGQPPAATLPVTVHSTPAADTRDRDGVLKGRISGNWVSSSRSPLRIVLSSEGADLFPVNCVTVRSTDTKLPGILRCQLGYSQSAKTDQEYRSRGPVFHLMQSR